MVVIAVMLVGLLTFIIFSELSYDDKNEKIFKDFFRFFRKIDPHSDDIALTFKQFLAFYNVSSSSWENTSILIFGLSTEIITIRKSSVLNSKLMATR